MRFRSKVYEVQAEQYSAGRELELGVCKQLCQGFAQGDCGAPRPHIHIEGDRLLYLREGDWVVVETNGTRYPLSRASFDLTFEAIQEDKKEVADAASDENTEEAQADAPAPEAPAAEAEASVEHAEPEPSCLRPRVPRKPRTK